MKNSFKLKGLTLNAFVFLALGIFLYSCEKEITSSEEELNTDPLVQKIISMGFREDMIKDEGDFFLVEGDIAFDKDDLIRGDIAFDKDDLIKDGIIEGDNSKERQARTNGLIAYSRIDNITVRVDNSIPDGGTDDWRTEVQQAIQDWNNANSQLSLVFTTANTADITVQSDFGALPNGTIGDARFPSSNRAGNRIRINLDFNGNINVPTGQKRYNMVHELGHCIGLRHTNWDARGEANAIHIAGTPLVDGNSVMNGGTANFTWAGLSAGDVTAVRTLYPVCPPGENWVYDGAHCYSQVHFPNGYNPFIFGNGFYTQRNCGISTANNCCPPGFVFDGANCHSTINFPQNEWTPFIWGSSFYIYPSHLASQ